MEAAIYPSLMAVGVMRGARYFLPFRPNVQIAYYNAEKFVQYNLQPPRTWPELLAVARTFYAKEGTGRVLFTGAGGAPTTTQLVERFVNTLQVISASAPLQWLQLGGLASAAWQN